MKKCIVTLEGSSTYAQSAPIKEEKKKKESAADYEERTWRKRMHVDKATGEICIPPLALKNCIAEGAKFLSERIPGKGQATYTKHFEAGIMVDEPGLLGIPEEDVEGQAMFVPSDGKRGGGKRVWKTFPIVPPGWVTDMTVFVLDDTITKEVFENTLSQCGMFIGLGAMRPRNNGVWGRFVVKKVKWLPAPDMVVAA